ncbi:hypothetical protein OAF54_03195 [bacterium]|nr:hypothetical protein [bacterium]
MSWYRMHRGWMDDRLWSRDKYSKREAWCWIIENAMFKEYKDFVKGQAVLVPRGSMIFTERQLSDKWGWGRQQVRTFLKHLKADEKITVNLTQGITQISVMNYNTYQEKPPTDNQQVTQEQPKTNPLNKNDKNGKKEKNSIITPISPSKGKRKTSWSDSFIPSKENATKYWKDKGRSDLSYDEQMDKFKTFCLANGKTYVDWESGWRTWYCNAIKYNKPETEKKLTALEMAKIRMKERECV